MSIAREGPPPTSESAPATKLERLGAYELLLELASGGMATVYLARATDKRQGPPLVAIKRPHRHLTGDKTFVTMLVDEARLASAIDDPRVVKVRELGFDGGMPFIVMDYIEGASLAELRRELSALSRTIDVKVAVRIVLDALGGLHSAHELKDDNDRPLHIIHRDVSPHNILIGCDGRSYLTDFGIAKAEDRIQTTRTHEVKGKLAYLAPERVDRRRICTVQSDVFSMAVVLWECLAGRRLFRGEEAVDILQQIMSSPIDTLEEIGATVPRVLDDVIARALSRDLDTRYGSAHAFAHAIERAAGVEHLGTSADVARLMEAVFGPRMALRQSHVREAIGGNRFADLLRESGLPARDGAASAYVPSRQLVADLAPPMPTARYARGAELHRARLYLRRIPWRRAAAITTPVLTAAIGAIVALFVSTNHTKSAPIVIRNTPRTTMGITVPVQTSPARRVLVPMPFAASRVVFDDESRDLDPPTDVVAFEVHAGSGPQHRITAFAPDGTRAEGYAREEDGIVRADADGYTITAPVRAADTAAPAVRKRTSRPVGTVHDGFTKLN